MKPARRPFIRSFRIRIALITTGLAVGVIAALFVASSLVVVARRASIPSGGYQHSFLPTGTWSPTDISALRLVTIGANTWIGEAAVVMADVGECCMVAAGAVVASAVPDGIMVAGNPARFVRRVTAPADEVANDARVPSLH